MLKVDTKVKVKHVSEGETWNGRWRHMLKVDTKVNSKHISERETPKWKTRGRHRNKR